MIALDASALLALLFGEPGADVVATHLARCCMSTVNLAEVLGRFTRDGHPADLVRRRLAATPIAWVPFDADAAEVAASLVPATRAAGLSLGDRACIGLARQRGIPALTADRAWTTLDLGVEVRCIR